MPIALAALSGVLLILSFPPFGFGALAWIAFVPLLHAIFHCGRAKRAANLAAVTGLVFYSVSLHWLTKVFGVFAAAFWCIFALWLALPVAATWKLWRSDLLGKETHAWLRLALAAAIWIGVEYFRSEVWPLECSWLALGYSQAGSLPVLQAASWIGVYGLSGLIYLFNAAAAWALQKRSRAPLAAMSALLIVLTAAGSRRVADWTETGQPVRTTLVQNESFDLNVHLRASRHVDARGAELIVWPEYGFDVQPGQDASYQKLIARKLAKVPAIIVAAGAIIHDGVAGRGGIENFAWVLAPRGRLLGRYDKAHPIPFIEKRLAPNRDPRPIETQLGRIGIQICYDLDFEGGARRMAQLGAELLVVPNMDPLDWKDWQHRQHSGMAPMRAVESGLWIARAASSGISQIIDPLGRVRHSMETGRTGVLSGQARLHEGGTFYSQRGWLTGWLALSIAALFLAAWTFTAVRAYSR